MWRVPSNAALWMILQMYVLLGMGFTNTCAGSSGPRQLLAELLVKLFFFHLSLLIIIIIIILIIITFIMIIMIITILSPSSSSSSRHITGYPVHEQKSSIINESNAVFLQCRPPKVCYSQNDCLLQIRAGVLRRQSYECF